MPDRAPQKDIPAITTTAELAAFCESLRDESYITVDTEFLRETTYYPKLCLIQIAGSKAAALIDPLSKEIDLAPFFAWPRQIEVSADQWRAS